VGIVFLLIVACQPNSDRSAQLQNFADEFREANNAPTIDPMLALYHLEGSSARTISLLKNALLFELGLPIQSIEFKPLSGAPEERIHFTYQGIEHGPTLEPRLRMRVRYVTEDSFESTFTIGKNPNGAWRIVSSRPLEPIKAPQESD
jgi:hypothetical protein